MHGGEAKITAHTHKKRSLICSVRYLARGIKFNFHTHKKSPKFVLSCTKLFQHYWTGAEVGEWPWSNWKSLLMCLDREQEHLTAERRSQ